MHLRAFTAQLFIQQTPHEVLSGQSWLHLSSLTGVQALAHLNIRLKKDAIKSVMFAWSD